MEQISDLNDYVEREIYTQLKNRLDKNSAKRFNRWLKNRQPYDIARLLEKLDDQYFNIFVNKSNQPNLARVLENCQTEIQIRIIEKLDIKTVLPVFNYMSNDVITDILNQLPLRKTKIILKHMDPEKKDIIRDLMDYPEETAGGIMTTEFTSFPGKLPIKNVLQELKEIDINTVNLDKIFVVDDNNQLIGKVDIKDLLTVPGDCLLQEITRKEIITVSPEMDQEEVSRIVSQYDLKVIPVISDDNILLGIITVDDIIDVIQTETTEDMLKMVGIDKEERLSSSFKTSIKNRLPWLYINLATAFLAAFVVGMFEDVIARVVALAVAMPIVAGMGGNAGSQTLAIVIREIALGELSFKKNWRVVLKELALGLIHGTAIGLLTAVILYVNYNNIYLGLIIFLAVVANLVMAGLSGFLIPITLKGLGLDPALSAAIFLTTVTDVFGFFVFLGLARLFLEYL